MRCCEPWPNAWAPNWAARVTWWPGWAATSSWCWSSTAPASSSCERVAQTALDTVRRPVILDGHPIVVSASVGIVQHADDGTAGAAELMQAADTTMYWAKADGRDRYALFDAERHHVDVSRFALSARMPEALAHGEFVVEYQPLVRLQDQQIDRGGGAGPVAAAHR